TREVIRQPQQSPGMPRSIGLWSQSYGPRFRCCCCNFAIDADRIFHTSLAAHHSENLFTTFHALTPPAFAFNVVNAKRCTAGSESETHRQSVFHAGIVTKHPTALRTGNFPF